jgi:hypothetical protein
VRASPYIEPSERKEWIPRPGERVVVVATEWSVEHGHVGKIGHVVGTRGHMWLVCIGVRTSVHLFLSDMNPIEDGGN